LSLVGINIRSNIKIEINFSSALSDIKVERFVENSQPSTSLGLISNRFPTEAIKSDIEIQNTPKTIKVICKFEKALSGDSVLSSDAFTIQPTISAVVNCDTKILCDQLPKPIKGEITLKTTVDNRRVSVQELVRLGAPNNNVTTGR